MADSPEAEQMSKTMWRARLRGGRTMRDHCWLAAATVSTSCLLARLFSGADAVLSPSSSDACCSPWCCCKPLSPIWASRLSSGVPASVGCPAVGSQNL